MRRSGGNFGLLCLAMAALVAVAWVRSYEYVTQYYGVRLAPAASGRYLTERRWVGLGEGAIYLGGYTTQSPGFGVSFVETKNERVFWKLPADRAMGYLVPVNEWSHCRDGWTAARGSLGFSVVCHRQLIRDEDDVAAAEAPGEISPPVSEVRGGWLIGIPCWLLCAVLIIPAGVRWPIDLAAAVANACRVWCDRSLSFASTHAGAADVGQSTVHSHHAADMARRVVAPAYGGGLVWHAGPRRMLAGHHRWRVHHGRGGWGLGI